jgi:hypothetical protein
MSDGLVVMLALGGLAVAVLALAVRWAPGRYDVEDLTDRDADNNARRRPGTEPPDFSGWLLHRFRRRR